MHYDAGAHHAMSVPPPPRPGPARLAAAAALSLAAVRFASYPLADHPVATDVRHFLYYAARIARGALPHADFFENKPALAFFVGAALHRAGEALGVDPLLSVRVGYVMLAALGGLLVAAVHRRLAGGCPVSGLLALAAYCGFPLIGGLPCIGNVPKLLMALGASAAALFAFRGRWLLAGLAGGLAMQDWQVGGLVIAGAALAGWLSREGKRAVGQVLAGAALALLPLLVYYTAKGALGPLFEQTLLASVFRGVSTAQSRGVVADWPRRFQMIVSNPYSNAWLAWLALPGLLLFVRTLRRGGAEQPAAAGLAVCHYGLIGYSLLDFQAYGDLFVLQHTLAFFAGVALWSAYRPLADWSARGATEIRRRTAILAAAVVIVLIARPWVSHRDFRLVPRPPGPAVTLDAQRQVALRLAEPLRRGRAVVIGPSEVLVLTGAANPAPLVYWNAATWAYYRRDARETDGETLRRVVAATGAEVVVCDPEIPSAPPGPCAMAFGESGRRETGPGGYAVEIYAVGRDAPSAAR
jgi:hypothetical protein